jgi:hypothetical protein
MVKSGHGRPKKWGRLIELFSYRNHGETTETVFNTRQMASSADAVFLIAMPVSDQATAFRTACFSQHSLHGTHG